ncbi:putative phosphotransacetylase [Anaerosolibacter carboniphilus]|uniref:Phosphate propanoyltransferase n=1 Tax=Anaerosolibacter carboniphilus TaxID=1417629 RepID=A0A841KW83_9FIRM|nr:putative phosphotransacetylase [Anaerosolibacter carboniphilus]
MMIGDNQALVEKIVSEIVKRLQSYGEEPMVPIGVSNRHVHLSKEDLEILFGTGYELTKMKDLKQPGQYAAQETVTVIGPKGRFESVRILGPVRKETQLEVSISDGFVLGLKAPVRESGKTQDTPGIILKGPKGTVEKDYGVIAALRHIHMPPDYAAHFGLKDKEMVSVEVGGLRKVVFHNVLIRVSDQYVLEMHLDIDEANAGEIRNEALGKIVKG